MLRVGLTGGIGAGKTTVSRIFQAFGIPVLYADDVARHLMERDPGVMAGIRALFGNDIYSGNLLDRPAVSRAVFQDPVLLEKLNAIVHPATFAASDQWFAAQESAYAIKEAALFFETGTEKGVDVMIGVQAPDALRISRTMRRSNLTREEVLSRMDRQMPQDVKMDRCDFVIDNDDEHALLPQVSALHAQLTARSRG